MKKLALNLKANLSAALGLLLALASQVVFSQQRDIITPVSNQVFKLSDTSSFKSAADLQAAIATAESAGKALAADADAVKKNIAPAQSDLSKAETSKASYTTAVNAFNKADVEPYKKDLDNYNVAGKKYTDQLAKYNKAAQANNALPANQRKAATVAQLNKQRLQVDSMGKQLANWKTRLDAAKAKLDVKNAVLNKQMQEYRAAEQGPIGRLKAAKVKLKAISDQLTTCAQYAQKCHALLNSKFGAPAAAYTGYFVSPEYQRALSGINLQLVSLQFF